MPAIFYTGDMDGELYFTESDVAEFIRCKAAAFTLVATMLDAVGLTPQDVGRYYFSGGFGTYYDPESAVAVGLYPDVPRERITLLGNSSLAGARALLLDAGRWEQVQRICEKAVYIQFGEMDRFLENMVAA